MRERFEMWAGQGLPRGWAANMGGKFAEQDGDVVWPIVDTETCGPIDGFPRPEQMLCWCPTIEKQRQVYDMLSRSAEFQAVSWMWGYSEGSPILIDLARQEDGSVKYAVRQSGVCLTKAGEWEYEPMPSSRSDAFLERCRFDSWDDAAKAIRKYCNPGDLVVEDGNVG